MHPTKGKGLGLLKMGILRGGGAAGGKLNEKCRPGGRHLQVYLLEKGGVDMSWKPIGEGRKY